MTWLWLNLDVLATAPARLWVGRLPDNLPPRASLEEIRRGWRFETSDYQVGWAVLALGLLLLTVAGWSLLRRLLRGMRPPSWTFLKAARQAGLNRADAWLLWRVARTEHLPSGLTLMLSDSTLRHHGLRYLRSLTPGQRAAAAQRLAAIESRLFGSEARSHGATSDRPRPHHNHRAA